MGHTFLWGTGIEEVAKGVGPEHCQEGALSGGLGVESSPHWRPVSLIAEGPRSRCWVSVKRGNPLVFVTGPCASTMALAWCFHRNNLLPHWASILAPSQWAGRGQLGRQWASPTGNIYGTLRLPASALFQADCLPLLVGYALVTALGLIGINARLKWPNDLVIGNKKVGGILIEEKEGVKMVGVGVNLASCPPEEQRRSPKALAASCLKDMGHDDLAPLSLWRHLVRTGRDLLEELTPADLPGLMRGLQPLLAFAGETVWVNDYANPPYEARILGLSSNGGLKLRTGSGTRVVRSASISPLDG